MQITRAQFLRGLAGSSVAWASLTCLAWAEQSPTLEHLVEMEDAGDKLWANAEVMIAAQVRMALAALGPHLPEPNLGATQQQGHYVNADKTFYRKLAIALLCKAVAATPNFGLNKLVKGRETDAALAALLASAEAKREAAALYEHAFGGERGTLAVYRTDPGSWGARLGELAAKPEFMNTYKVMSANDPARARRRLKLILFKLRKLDAKHYERVKAVWAKENELFRGAIVDEEKWPPNLLNDILRDKNPTRDAMNRAMGASREGSSREWMCVIMSKYHAEPLVAAVRTHAPELGLATGANPDNEESNTYCSEPKW